MRPVYLLINILIIASVMALVFWLEYVNNMWALLSLFIPTVNYTREIES